MWFDSHCHLQDSDDPATVLAEARGAGVDRLVCVGTDPGQSSRAVELARGAGGGVWATVGQHPHEAAAGVEETAALLSTCLSGPDGALVVAVGECGLDYHYGGSPSVQRPVFADQIHLAARHGLALVVHSREAWADTFEVLHGEGVPERTIFHCFTGGPEEARRCLDLGAYLSFSGIVTFRNGEEVRAAAALCPADRLLVETDSPYLAPVPHRGRPNQPCFLPAVGAGVAAARGEPVEAVAEASALAAAAAFGLPAGG